MTAVTLLVNWGLMSSAAVVALALPFESPGLFARMSLPFAAQFVIGAVALDFFFGYLAHRLLHAWPAMWKFHRVHHSDAFVDVTTTYRTHPVESAWRYLFMLIPIAVLGIPASAVVLYRLLSAVNAIFEHANIRVSASLDSAVSRLWVTPNMHKVHHSRVATETDTNYGNLLAIYDRALGTFTPTTRAFRVDYGLDDAEEAAMESTGALLAMPWRQGRTGARAEVSPA